MTWGSCGSCSEVGGLEWLLGAFRSPSETCFEVGVLKWLTQVFLVGSMTIQTLAFSIAVKMLTAETLPGEASGMTSRSG